MENNSIINFFEKYGSDFEPTMTLKPEMDFAVWRKDFMNILKKLRGRVLKGVVKSQYEIQESIDFKTHIAHRISIRHNKYYKLPAILLIPKSLKEETKIPAVVALHGHTQFGMESIAGFDNAETAEHPYRSYGRRAVEAGYITLCPSWWGWPGRDADNDKVGTRDKCNVQQMAASMYGINILSMHIEDGIACVDILSRMSEVDSDNIGCIGNSYGGRTAMWLSVFDERIKATVAAGSMNLFRERSLKLSSCDLQCFHGLLEYGDVGEVFSMIAPRSLQLMAGNEDELIFPKDRDAILDTARIAYKAMDAEKNLVYSQHPEGHLISWDMAEEFFNAKLHSSEY